MPTETRKIYHLIGLAGLMFLLAQTTSMVAETIGFVGVIEPVIGYAAAVLAFLGVAAGTIWLTVYYRFHLVKEA